MSDTTIVDGSIDFSQSVDSLKTTTIASPRNPNGLARSEVAWLNNMTVRDGGITIRNGWQRMGRCHSGNAIFQGKFMYHPTDGNPYVMASIGGHIYKIDPDNADAAIDLSTSPGLVNPSGQLQSYFVQGEQFLVIQAGDYVTLPLFWDGATLRRSVGLSATSGLVLVVAGFQLNNFIVPTQGGQTGLGFPPVLAAGDTIRMIQSGTTSSIGDFQVTSYSVTEADMIKLDPNQQAYTTNIKVDIYQVIAPSTAELPAAGPMDYYMGRIWYAQGRIYSAGDTV